MVYFSSNQSMKHIQKYSFQSLNSGFALTFDYVEQRIELLEYFLGLKQFLTNPMTFKRMVIGTSGLREEDDYERPNRCLPRNDDVWPS